MLLEKGFDLCTPWGNTHKKLKDFNDNDFYWLSESDKIKLLQDFKEEYQTLLIDYEAMKQEHYRVLNFAKEKFEKISANFCIERKN